MAYNEQEARFFLIDRLLRDKGYNSHQRINMQTPAPVEPTGYKGRRRKDLSEDRGGNQANLNGALLKALQVPQRILAQAFEQVAA